MKEPVGIRRRGEREGYRSEQIRNEAFAHVDLNKMQQKVLDAIDELQPVSNDRIASHLGIFPHQVTPRVLELRQMGIVEFCGETFSGISGRKVSLWRINPNGTQLSLTF
ncbi:MAG: hypothetical protein IT281_04905 [Ignavibacteria bacterium]|nr:hypothetical protein [Ignavibacteria bacterium]